MKKILGGLLLAIICTPYAQAQKFQWVYELPSATATRILDPSKRTEHYLFQTIETGLYYKKKWGLSIGHSWMRNDISEKSMNELIVQTNPEWKDYFRYVDGLALSANLYRVKLSWRILEKNKWMIEPNFGFLVMESGEREIPWGRFVRSTADNHSASLRLYRKPQVNIAPSYGLLLQYNLQQLGLFLNVSRLKTPIRTIEATERISSENTFETNWTARETVALTFEFGLRVHIDKPFGWIKVE